jgi:hypothetical protein
MTTKVYLEQIVSVIQQWINCEDSFVLEEDRDSVYTSKQVEKKKKAIGLDYYLNAPKSPDINSVENI